MTPENIMKLLQTRVQQRSVKTTYQVLDDDRSGMVDVDEVVEGLSRLQIHVTPEEAQDLMENINAKIQPDNPSREEVGYAAFAAAFNQDDDSDLQAEVFHEANAKHEATVRAPDVPTA